MKPIPLNSETEAIARRVIWFEEPDRALADPVRFMAYAFAYANHEDMKFLQGLFSSQDLQFALQTSPPGIIDPRSWAFWNSKLGNWPPPPMPQRRL